MNEPRQGGLLAAHGSTDNLGRALPQRISKMPGGGGRSSEALRNNMRVNPDVGRKSRDPRNMVHILRAARSGKVTCEKEKPGSSPGTATQQKGTEPGCV